MKLHGRIKTTLRGKPRILRLRRSESSLEDTHDALLVHGQVEDRPHRHRHLVLVDTSDRWPELVSPEMTVLTRHFDYLNDGDIIRVNPTAQAINVLYRRSSAHNSLLVTERCNSNCLMCSQPPKPDNDGYIVDELLEAIPLMSPDTAEIGITGGEPTLLGGRLVELLGALRMHLPTTGLHVLTNGRQFRDTRYVRMISHLEHPDLMFGIPLYSDLPADHDFVVQARGAFDETIRGFLNLARHRVLVELRVVIHAQTYRRLPQLGRFIARNLPFVNHVALMGLEMMGHVKMNLDALWVDPVDYQAELCECVHHLDLAGLNVSVYNHQLCTLDRSLWPFARKSISDWKNVYLPCCEPCNAQSECGGFFASALLRYSDHIHPFTA